MNDKMKLLIGAGVAATAVVVGVGSYFMFRNKKTPAPANDTATVAKTAEAV